MEVATTTSAGLPESVTRVLAVSVRTRLNDSFELSVEHAFLPGITILFGASGAGKTTLLDCIAGLTRADAGSIRSGDRVLFDSNGGVDIPAQNRRAGYLFQTLALFPHISVMANVTYGLANLPHSEGNRRAMTLLESFRVAHLSGRRPGEISGGERQRVALARALVTDPDFLLLDEPLIGLDAVAKSRIIEDLRAWNREHAIPIIYVTHDRDEVAALGERLVVLEKGTVVAEGEAREVLKYPELETVAHLAGFENIFDVEVAAINEAAGTMTCRIGSSDMTLETPIVRRRPDAGLKLGLRAGDILLATEAPRNISARNILPGVVVALEHGARFEILKVDCGVVFNVHVTKGAVETLQLRTGSNVWILVKTNSCHLLAP